ncbi:hypothetical protein J5N97_017547 [Dioscorea zingiberensis]|uniref:Anaphase-promoting complex subunit 11 n=1 Tax=Dioscorea zingiberensis TaxID=325984 RepID=A0A9D5CNH4_9LILI|nr:hypothetical protein J5N97_017547 [Dioscorea zingiberensis]
MPVLFSGGAMKVKILQWHAVASWTWDAQDETCGICRMAFDGCCPDCKFPGDDCPLIWGACNHSFHLHCILKWNNIQVNEHNNTRDEKEDIKPSRIPALKLKIGSWEKKSTSDGETRVEAKFYYLKKQIVWEILDTALNKKRKIEIKFDDISGIKAFSQKGEASSTLIVQVKQAPLLWIEKEPEPMKHTIWMQETDDFTHGQVATNMIHELEFEEGQLEKHYDKLMRFDSRLHSISQNPTNISIHSERTQLAAVEEFLMNDQQQGDIDVGDEDATFLSFANELPDL